MEADQKSPYTINGTRKALNRLARTVDLKNPEQVKRQIASYESNAYKHTSLEAYGRYAKYYKIEWERPTVKVVNREIQLPRTEQINILIVSAKEPLSTKIQTAHETGLRPIELCRLKVADYDPTTKRLYPKTAKGGKPRQIPLKDQLNTRIQEHIKRKNLQPNDNLFGSDPHKLSESFRFLRQTVAKKTKDPTYLQITLYSLRHKFCMDSIEDYKDPYTVQYLMGHRHLSTTDKYVHLNKILHLFQKEEYITKAANTMEEIIDLCNAGFTKVTEFNGYQIFRKRK